MKAALLIIVIFICCGCGSTSFKDISTWENEKNIEKLSEVAGKESEKAIMRKKALESLARLNWRPSNDERLQVYRMFASDTHYYEAKKLLTTTINQEQMYAIDDIVVQTSRLLTRRGKWTNRDEARGLFTRIRAQNEKAVIISMCQQVVARPNLQTQLILMAIKLGIAESQDELVAVLYVYGNKSMAEDYLNSGSSVLAAGGRTWAQRHGYYVARGYGSNRAGWGKF